ncbi:unnamed protein product [Diatraea saccharalis]|uniref:Uncharacterized protein n=1 Tax=Diatraea saccharalis TaxID=40085 RepID=A0A9N9R571_9NEOP|nr:unnamed protein product [Diatraea saccharalis]
MTSEKRCCIPNCGSSITRPPLKDLTNEIQSSDSVHNLNVLCGTSHSNVESQLQDNQNLVQMDQLFSCRKRTDFSSFKTFVWKSLGIIKSQIELLALGVDHLDTHSRRKVLLFHGIREDKDEVVISKIGAVLNNQMQMVELSSDTIETCHRLGAKKKDVSQPILVRFTTMKHRMAVWNRKTQLKGSNVTLSEFLTKARQDIFVAARKHFGRKKCWSTEGTIIVLLSDGTKRKIFSNSELQQLILKYPVQSAEVTDNKR